MRARQLDIQCWTAKEESCSLVQVRQLGEQLIPRRAQMSNRASVITVILSLISTHMYVIKGLNNSV